jgi:hypothetical protein
MKHFQTNTKVSWEWGKGTATGYIRKKYTSKIEKTIGGSDVTRNASEDDPAYLIEQDDGQEVLKSGTELSKAN